MYPNEHPGLQNCPNTQNLPSTLYFAIGRAFSSKQSPQCKQSPLTSDGQLSSALLDARGCLVTAKIALSLWTLEGYTTSKVFRVLSPSML
jgi:hypothetical protein